MADDTILWRRLDLPGHDVCRIEAAESGGWRLDGTAVFRHGEGPACLAYRVTCDGEFRTREGSVHGWVGARSIDVRVARSAAGGWSLNGEAVPRLDDCVDLDLSFTPATNLFQLRRVGLPVGQVAAMAVAWLDVPAGTLQALHQRYERRTEDTYWYEAPRFGYAAFLGVGPNGFIHQYPGLWAAQP